jgi:hypothetical protein
MKRAIVIGDQVECSYLLASWGGVRRRSGFTVLLISECCKLTGLTLAWLGRWRAARSCLALHGFFGLIWGAFPRRLRIA